MENSEEDEDDAYSKVFWKDNEAARIFREDGVAALIKHANEKLDEWKTIEVNIAVVGQSGSGKSSFINTMRNVDDPDDLLWAATGAVETTSERKSFQFPNNSLIKMWDLPGAGTEQFKAEVYAAEMEFLKYDAFVILSCDRFTEIDKMIANEIENQKKPFFFARTKMDDVMRNEKRNKKKKFDRNKTKEDIINDIRGKIGECRQEMIYLIANLPEFDDELLENFADNDNKRLKEAIMESLSTIQKNAIVCSLVADSEKMVTLKAEQLNKLSTWRFIASVAIGSEIMNIGNLGSANLGYGYAKFFDLVTSALKGKVATTEAFADADAIEFRTLVIEANFQKKQLGIDDETINGMALKVGSDKETMVRMIETNLKKTENMSPFIEQILSVMLLSPSCQETEMSELLSSQAPVSRPVTAVGRTIRSVPYLGAGISARNAFSLMPRMIDAHSVIAQECIKVFSQLGSELKYK